MTGWLLKKTTAVRDRSSLLITSAINEPAYTRMADSACAHSTGLERNVKCEADQAIVAERGAACPQSQNLCMRGRVMKTQRPVMRLRDHSACRGIHENGANRGLPGLCGRLRHREGAAHHDDVAIIHHDAP